MSYYKGVHIFSGYYFTQNGLIGFFKDSKILVIRPYLEVNISLLLGEPGVLMWCLESGKEMFKDFRLTQYFVQALINNSISSAPAVTTGETLAAEVVPDNGAQVLLLSLFYHVTIVGNWPGYLIS